VERHAVICFQCDVRPDQHGVSGYHIWKHSF
jgi:hypothetical protein